MVFSIAPLLTQPCGGSGKGSPRWTSRGCGFRAGLRVDSPPASFLAWPEHGHSGVAENGLFLPGLSFKARSPGASWDFCPHSECGRLLCEGPRQPGPAWGAGWWCPPLQHLLPGCPTPAALVLCRGTMIPLLLTSPGDVPQLCVAESYPSLREELKRLFLASRAPGHVCPRCAPSAPLRRDHRGRVCVP